ncbi:hypothetical protein LMG24238_00086 [Paraburkholderia sediminicola]|uniref:Uncharacterized protein n=1 Tax=Paraburkholderia sediminicola TaxID=458836 RepID=A0A6J4ZP27_9BURK|nr:hypothetical protein [Paraburkholderia sediminicola]CAB3638775.1 hypothetical protein LMG24238_00086 [Paraburkholderia sediminicola]
MSEIQLFASRNDYYSSQTEAGDRRILRRYGWCVAASVLWTKTALDPAVAPKDSNPDKMRTGILQVKYRWNVGTEQEATLNLLQQAELQGAQMGDQVSLTALFGIVFATPGVYLIANDTHMMAVDTRAGRLHFYDIEEGLFHYASAAELEQGIRARYQDPHWDVYSVARH